MARLSKKKAKASTVDNASALDKVFRVNELLDTIFRHSSEKSLAACARVCRTWEVPALRVLWRVLDFVGSAALFRQARLDYANYNSLLNGDTWTRLCRYASFVRRLSLNLGENGVDTARVQHIRDAVLEAQARGTPLFPSLNSLLLSPSYTSDPYKVSMLLIENHIRDLTLDWAAAAAADQTLIPFLVRTQHCSPNLTSLRITTPRTRAWKGDDGPPAIAVCQLLQSLLHLEELCLPTDLQFHSDVWNATVALPELRMIRITRVDVRRSAAVVPPDSSPSLPPGSVFLSLTDIICDIPYAFVRSVFSGTSQPELRRASFTLCDIPEEHTLDGIIGAVTAGAPQLSHLTLRAMSRNLPLRLDHLIPHCGLSKLSVVKIQTRDVPLLTDDDYEELAQALPHLVELCLSPWLLRGPEEAKASLVALGHIARYCRKIQTIAIFLDTSGPYPDASSLGCFSGSVRVLNFGSSSVDNINTVPVALHLVHMTRGSQPEVCSREIADFQNGYSGDTERDWKRVSRAMCELRPLIEANESHERQLAELSARVVALEAEVAQRDARIRALEA